MAIDNEDMERLKEVFVTRQECTTTNEEIKREISKDSTKIAVIEQRVSSINWVSKTTLAAIIGAIVVYVMNLILR